MVTANRPQAISIRLTQLDTYATASARPPRTLLSFSSGSRPICQLSAIWNGDGRDSSGIYRAATGEVTYSPAWPRTPRYPTLAANPIPNQWWRIGPGTDATRSPSYAARAGTVDLRTAPARRAFLPRSFSLARRARSPLGGRWKAPKATAQGSAAPQFVGLLAGSMSEGKRSWPRCVKSIPRRVVATESTWLFLATFRCGFAVGGLTAEGSIHRQTKSLTG